MLASSATVYCLFSEEKIRRDDLFSYCQIFLAVGVTVSEWM